MKYTDATKDDTHVFQAAEWHQFYTKRNGKWYVYVSWSDNWYQAVTRSRFSGLKSLKKSIGTIMSEAF